jgi:hypothetical protein
MMEAETISDIETDSILTWLMPKKILLQNIANAMTHPKMYFGQS